MGEDQRIEAATVGDIHAAVFQDVMEGLGRVEEQSRVGILAAMSDQWQAAAVKSSINNQPPGLSAATIFANARRPVQAVQKHQTSVDDGEASFVEVVVDDVMTANLEI
jgi:hypothetical protein